MVSKIEGITHGAALDPLSECVAELATRFGPSFDPSLLNHLPRNAEGKLPWHQAGAALELSRLNYDPLQPRKLPRAAANYPALVHLEGGDAAIVLETNGQDLLVWRPTTRTEQWVAFNELQQQYAGSLMRIFGNPDELRANEAPWHEKTRSHWFWSELRKERRAFAPVFLASFLINMLAIALPIFTMNVYDRVIPNKAAETLWILGVGVVIAFALEFALRRARTAVIDEITRRLDLRLSQKIFGRLLAAPLAERRGHTGSLAARVAEFTTVRDFFASTTVVMAIDVLFLFVFVFVIAIIAGWLALVPLVIVIAMLAAGYVLQRRVVAASRDAQADHGLQQTLLVESLGGMETLKSLAGEGAMLSRWHRLAEIGTHSQQRLRDVSSYAVGLAQTFQQVSTVSLVIGGYYLFAAGDISMGAIIAIVMLSSRSLAPAGQIAFLLTRGRQAQDTLDSIERMFEGGDERRSGSSLSTSTLERPTIRLAGLSFSYGEGSQEALADINLTITPGERIAIVGRVASGKSTLGRVLCGLYPPSSGALVINGVDSQQFRPEQLRRALRFVGQDAVLFTGSIKDNLSLSDPLVDDAKLVSALRMTGADQFLSRDSGGFDRLVGEDGRHLSGGQRAFLSLSRALVDPAELLFLDEPTGAMDSETEKLFVERLGASIGPEQSLIIATHRPALFAICNRLIVLDRGRVVADGPVNKILAEAGSTLAQGQKP
ncbi:ATP-binding cassette domain-containing protein [Erythrobacter mangrovi]|uniref:ATP-binding cassette domain-containing protein n=1 Tax=Erythrobacter mangrovi TaxID=2739433 RepID=A0A7D3XT75_9SPHN|nr:ABC transporter transmembrane domain-containing protein [Erythrobacter mangrovi]QKG72231.1 ATP-binding cassette domain-containing protein [Erythrobacter mangrovi]